MQSNIRSRNKTAYIFLLSALIILSFLTVQAIQSQSTTRALTFSGSKRHSTPTPSPSPTPSPTPTPTPSPTSSSSGTNFAPIDPSCAHTYNWMVSWYSNLAWDYTTEYVSGVPSVEIMPVGNSGNSACECDLSGSSSNYPYVDVPVVPGDTVVFSAWIQISGGTYSTPYAGARIGIDLNAVCWNAQCSAYVRVNLYGLSSPTYPDSDSGTIQNYVPVGTSGWVERTISFTVPSTQFTNDNYSGQTLSALSGGTTTALEISQIGCWMQVWGTGTSTATALFTDTSLQIIS